MAAVASVTDVACLHRRKAERHAGYLDHTALRTGASGLAWSAGDRRDVISNTHCQSCLGQAMTACLY
jgi:hypothetical protein